jgi:hypothetical protein
MKISFLSIYKTSSGLNLWFRVFFTMTKFTMNSATYDTEGTGGIRNPCCGSGSIIVCTDQDQDQDLSPDPDLSIIKQKSK